MIDKIISTPYKVLKYMYSLHVELPTGELCFPFPPTDIAEHFQLSRTRINAVLSKLRDEGLIKISSKKCRYAITEKGITFLSSVEEAVKEETER